MQVHAYTSFSYSYLNRARVLAETLRRLHPEWVLWAVITDKEPPRFSFDITSENFDHVLTAEQLFGDETESWLFGMDVVEACTAVKGEALKRILDAPGVGAVLYFDPDIAAFSDMGSLVHELERSSLLLTPHQTDPEPRGSAQAIMDNEISALQYGAFNLGFIGVRNDPEGRRFAGWWDDRLRDWCHDRLDIGVFVDQKWCNLVPCFFDDVKIIRDPGCNVASWNLSQRLIETSAAGEVLVNGTPLKFYHFTKLGPIGDAMTQRYAGDNANVFEIWWWYARRVEAHTDAGIPTRWWYYGVFDNGVSIPKEARVLYRSRKDLRDAFPKPFSVSSGYYDWCISNGIEMNTPH